ncbi:MAG: hypothetical protein AAGA86_05480 [Bacteroidota bacterium]
MAQSLSKENPNYHTSGDTREILDFDKMTQVIQQEHRAILEL